MQNLKKKTSSVTMTLVVQHDEDTYKHN